jgi:hypothetical protein
LSILSVTGRELELLNDLFLDASALARIDPGLLARIGPPTFTIEYDDESESITIDGG